MNHFRGTTREVKKNVFNTPICVKWTARFDPESEGIRKGLVRLSMGDSEKSIVVRATTSRGKLSCEMDALQGVEQGRRGNGCGSYKPLDIAAIPGFAKMFLSTIKSRLERDWTSISAKLRPDGRQLVGHGNLVILPQEWGQNHDDVMHLPYVSIIPTAMGGMNKRR